MKQIKHNYIAISLSFFFLFLNLFLFKYLQLPWIDEVMFSDTAINFSSGLGWTTKAWYSMANGKFDPISTYPPLYQLLLSLWVKVFGINFFAIRSFNLCIAFILSVLFINHFWKTNLNKNKYSSCLFILIFWSAEVFSWIYSNGRVEMVGMTIAFIYFINVCGFLDGRKNTFYLIILGILILFSGIQIVPFVVAALLYYYIINESNRKSLFQLAKYMMVSIFIGFILLMSFFLYLNALLPFLISVVSYSQTLKTIAFTFGSGIISKITHVDLTKTGAFATLQRSDPFLTRILYSYKQNVESLYLAFVSIFYCAYMKLFKYDMYINKAYFQVLLFGLLVPIIMNLAGRYSQYYTWMSFLPICVGFIGLLSTNTNKYWKVIFHIPILLIVSTGLLTRINIINSSVISKIDKLDENYYDYEKFILKNQQALKNKRIGTCFATYYLARDLSQQTFAVGIFSIDKINVKLDYLIDRTIEADSHFAIEKICNKYRIQNINFFVVDSLPKVGLFLIKIN